MIRNLIKRALCDHDYGQWLYGYPTMDSVAQYSTCERCGKKRKNWVVKPGEGHIPEAIKERRENP